MAQSLGEFELIDKLLKPLAQHAAARGLTDDAAVLTPPAGSDLVVTKDMLVEGVHFLADDPPADIAGKALRVNLSDLAAMGAEGIGYLTGLSYAAGRDPDWLTRFVSGWAEDQEAFGVSLLGGDITSTPGPMTISVTAIGAVPAGRAVARRGAMPGDVILVSGTIGDATLGLAVAKGEIVDSPRGFLLSRYRRPTPRLALAPLLRDYAHAAIDVSDGVVSDIRHIAEESGVRAVIAGGNLPLSPEAARLVGRRPAWLGQLLTGGDDYEILLAVKPQDVEAAQKAAADLHVPLTSIGHIEAGSGVTVLDADGREMTLPQGGFTHF